MSKKITIVLGFILSCSLFLFCNTAHALYYQLPPTINIINITENEGIVYITVEFAAGQTVTDEGTSNGYIKKLSLKIYGDSYLQTLSYTFPTPFPESGSYIFQWHSPSFYQGTFNFEAEAYDPTIWSIPGEPATGSVNINNPLPEITSTNIQEGIVSVTSSFFAVSGVKHMSLWIEKTDGTFVFNIPHTFNQYPFPTSGTHTFTWASPSFTKEDYVFKVIVSDFSQMRTGVSEPVTLSIDNPLPEILSPLNGDRINGIVPVAVSYFATRGVKYLTLNISGPSNVITLTHNFSFPLPKSGIYTFDWDTDTLPEGEYQLRATAFDQSQFRAGTSTPVTVILSLVPPIPVPPDPDTMTTQEFDKYIEDLTDYLRYYAEQNGYNEIIAVLDAIETQEPDKIEYDSALSEPEEVRLPGQDGLLFTEDDVVTKFVTYGTYSTLRGDISIGSAALRTNYDATDTLLHEGLHAYEDMMRDRGEFIDLDGDNIDDQAERLYSNDLSIYNDEEDLAEAFANTYNPF